MTEQAAGQRTLVSLQINAQPLNDGQLEVLFTGVDAAGDPLTGSVMVPTQQFMQSRDNLTQAAATMAPAPVGWYGQDQARIGFDLTQGGSGGLEFVFTVANPTGEAGYQPPSLRAPVSSAALTRLADGLGQIVQGGEEVVDWVPAE
jgi:hypothetical protein